MLPTKEDDDFWRDVVKDIKPNNKTNKIISKNKPVIKIKSHRQYAVKQDFSTYSKALEDIYGGIDKATIKKFKKEEFKIEAVLDLHGLTEDEAFEKVENFVVQSYNKGKRCIIIITGKGLSIHESDDVFAPKGVLKKQVPQWLNMARLRSMILTYKNPSERLGGAGALYILLKRNKSLS